MNRARLLPLIFVATAAPLLAQPTRPATGASSAVEWGAPARSAASAATGPVERRPAPRVDTPATDDYFHDFAELIVRVRSVGWIGDVCSDAFPATADANRHAYAVWLAEHRAFVDEMEGQFGVIDKYWGAASAQASKDGLTVDQLRARVDANRTGLGQDLRARGPRAFKARCDAYPEILLSPQLDLEHAQPDLVRSVRMGPGRAD